MDEAPHLQHRHEPVDGAQALELVHAVSVEPVVLLDLIHARPQPVQPHRVQRIVEDLRRDELAVAVLQRMQVFLRIHYAPFVLFRYRLAVNDLTMQV